ncbi:MAG: glycoside hydrolase family 31 protein [Deltaproteobacteria bacterium]|nr:glycoside hydrolase family 31 protein [Deltaproteobacteria bacterium]
MDRVTRLALGTLATLAAGCSDATERRVITAELRAGDYRLIVDDRPGIRLQRVDDELVRFDPDGIRLGLAGPVDDRTNYDPYRLFVPSGLYLPPVEPRFVAPISATFEPSEEGELRLALRFEGGLAADLTASVRGEGRFALQLTPTSGVTDVAYLDLRAHGHETEEFYGLGELSDDVNQRGKIRAMQIEVETTNESGYNDGHAPIPLLVGTRGWGLFIATRFPTAFAVATESDDLIEATVGTGPRSTDGLTFHLFGAQHPLDVPARYYATTGAPRLPARWALGPWVWRDENDDQAQVERDLDTLRDLDLATTGYWIDRPYATGVNTFDFEAKRFPDAPSMLAKARALGMPTALWHVPYLDENDPSTAPLLAEAKTHGYYPTEHGAALNKWGTLLDLTHPGAVEFWQKKLQNYVDLGIVGFKLDYAEDIVIGPTANRVKWTFADGSDERTQHSEYQLLYHRTYADLLPEAGGFLLARTARWGDHVNGTVLWPGDLDATFARRGEAMKDGDESYLATGGFPASIVCGLTLAASGHAFYGADTGGYRHAPPDNELFSRWFEQTALSVVMQVGTNTNDVAWEPTEKNGFDAALLARYRTYARLHLRLFPYLWSHAAKLPSGGRPIARALGLAYPELGVHPNDVYLLGDDLLVAPVVTRGAVAREVVFPPGRWVHWFTGDVVDGDALGGKPRTIDAPIGRLPLFLRSGGLVPMLRPTIDTLAPTTEPARVDSYATKTGLLYVRGVAATTGTFDLFDGCQVRSLTYEGETTLTFDAGTELDEGAVFELLDADAPESIDGGASRASAEEVASLGGYHHDASRRVLWIAVKPGIPVIVRWP